MNGPLDYTQNGRLFEQLNDFQLLKEGYVLWSEFGSLETRSSGSNLFLCRHTRMLQFNSNNNNNNNNNSTTSNIIITDGKETHVLLYVYIYMECLDWVLCEVQICLSQPIIVA
jgi:hypothetical protein